MTTFVYVVCPLLQMLVVWWPFSWFSEWLFLLLSMKILLMAITTERIVADPSSARRSMSHGAAFRRLTNSNYRVVVDGTPYFVRIPGRQVLSRLSSLSHTRSGQRRVAGAQGIKSAPPCPRIDTSRTIPS